MRIAAISSKKFGDIYEGSLKNNYLYQGAYSELDDDIGWHDFMLRNYDPQVGRFVQQDPYQQFASPYTGMGNDPINMNDPSGGIAGLPCPGTSGLAIFLSNAIYATTSFVSTYSSLISALGTGAKIASTGLFVGQAIQASEQINGVMATMQAGGHVDPNGKELSVFGDENPELFNGGENVVSGTKTTTKALKGSVRSFRAPESVTITKDFSFITSVKTSRFVAIFDKTTGNFVDYGWDQDLSYTLSDYYEDLKASISNQLDNQENPLYQHYASAEEARKSLINLGLSVVVPPVIKGATIGVNATNGSKELYKFGGSAGRHMAESGRSVPVQILEQAIKGSKGVVDPKGSQALMHYIQMTKNGKLYNLEVLYNKSTNTIWHFKYTRDAIGPLKAISK